MRLSTAVGWNEQNRHPGDERFASVSRAPSAVHGRKVCEAKELIRKVAAPGSAGRSLVKPFEPRRPGGQVKRERPTADDYFRRERRQRMMVRRCQAAHNRDYRRVRKFPRVVSPGVVYVRAAGIAVLPRRAANRVISLNIRRRRMVNLRHPQSLHSLPLAAAHHRCGNECRWARR